MAAWIRTFASSAAVAVFAAVLFGAVHVMTDAASARAASYVAPTYGPAMLAVAEEAFF